VLQDSNSQIKISVFASLFCRFISIFLPLPPIKSYRECCQAKASLPPQITLAIDSCRFGKLLMANFVTPGYVDLSQTLTFSEDFYVT
jgi:hypothetical protein